MGLECLPHSVPGRIKGVKCKVLAECLTFNKYHIIITLCNIIILKKTRKEEWVHMWCFSPWFSLQRRLNSQSQFAKLEFAIHTNVYIHTYIQVYHTYKSDKFFILYLFNWDIVGLPNYVVVVVVINAVYSNSYGFQWFLWGQTGWLSFCVHSSFF